MTTQGEVPSLTIQQLSIFARIFTRIVIKARSFRRQQRAETEAVGEYVIIGCGGGGAKATEFDPPDAWPGIAVNGIVNVGSGSVDVTPRDL